MKPETSQPGSFKKSLGPLFGIPVLFLAFGLSLWSTGIFYHWLETMVGNRGAGPKALLSFLPVLVWFGTFFISIFLIMFLAIFIVVGLKKLFGKSKGSSPSGAQESTKTTNRGHKKESYSSVVVLDGSLLPEGQPAGKDPTPILVSIIGLLVWTFCFKLYYQAVNQVDWRFYLLYGAGAILCLYLLHYGLHHQHAIVRRYIPAYNTDPRHGLRVVMAICLLLFGATAGIAWLFQSHLKRDTQSAEGVVTRLVYHHGYKGGVYRVEVRFTDLQNKVQVQECWGGSQSDIFLPDPDTKVEVLYNPFDPTDCTINNFTNQWSGPLFFLCMALFLLAALIWKILKSKM